MRRHILSLTLALAAPVALTGCTTERHSAVVGNYKIVSGRMGASARRWEIVKAAVAGWEVVAATDDDDYGVLVLRKSK